MVWLQIDPPAARQAVFMPIPRAILLFQSLSPTKPNSLLLPVAKRKKKEKNGIPITGRLVELLFLLFGAAFISSWPPQE